MKRGFNRIALVGAVTLLVSAAFHFISSNNASLSYVYTAEMFDKGATCLILSIVWPAGWLTVSGLCGAL